DVVLTGEVGRGPAQRQAEGLGARRLVSDGEHGRGLPRARRSDLSPPGSAARATGRRGRGSRCAPRTRPGRGRGGGFATPTCRSSRSTVPEPAGGPGLRDRPAMVPPRTATPATP